MRPKIIWNALQISTNQKIFLKLFCLTGYKTVYNFINSAESITPFC